MLNEFYRLLARISTPEQWATSDFCFENERAGSILRFALAEKARDAAGKQF
jgi:hypothetical protein